MWAFKRRLARLTTTLSFTTTKNVSYWRPGIATRGAPVVRWLYTPSLQFKKLRTDFRFFRRSAVHFWSGTEKLVKIKRLACMMSTKNMRGWENLSLPIPGRGLSHTYKKQNFILSLCNFISEPLSLSGSSRMRKIFFAIAKTNRRHFRYRLWLICRRLWPEKVIVEVRCAGSDSDRRN